MVFELTPSDAAKFENEKKEQGEAENLNKLSLEISRVLKDFAYEEGNQLLGQSTLLKLKNSDSETDPSEAKKIDQKKKNSRISKYAEELDRAISKFFSELKIDHIDNQQLIRAAYEQVVLDIYAEIIDQRNSIFGFDSFYNPNDKAFRIGLASKLIEDKSVKDVGLLLFYKLVNHKKVSNYQSDNFLVRNAIQVGLAAQLEPALTQPLIIDEMVAKACNTLEIIYDFGDIGLTRNLEELNLPNYLEQLCAKWELTKLDQVLEFASSEPFARYVKHVRASEIEPILGKDDLRILDNTPLRILEIELLLQEGISLEIIESGQENVYEKALEIFPKKLNDWFEDPILYSNLKIACDTFGYKKMFEYISREGLSQHDSMHTFIKIIELQKASGIEPKQFYGQILHQVQLDQSDYQEGTAHHHLNSIAQTANLDIEAVISNAQQYQDIQRLQSLTRSFYSPEAVFASWNNLKRFSELEQLLGRTEILDQLKELRAEGKEDLYKYIETLAFHPDSKVNMQAVIQFWREPEAFLAAYASHTPDAVQDRKKPSNYFNMPNLDLTAIELRDALVEGKIDQLQAFTPLEIRYTMPLVIERSEKLPELVYKALGSRKKQIKGEAQNPDRLFSELNNLFMSNSGKLLTYLAGEPLPLGICEEDIEAILFNEEFGLERPKGKTASFVARINKKSDPEGAIAGDDTVNCMPFGDGKNTVYTFNPNTAQFIIRISRENGSERTIAQSVLTKDMDVKISVPTLIYSLESDENSGRQNLHLENLLPAQVLDTAVAYAAADNVEVSPNFSNNLYQSIIQTIMTDFFAEYMNRHGNAQGLEKSRMPVGKGYSDALTNLPEVPNTFVPQAPVSYSDKTGENVYILDLSRGSDGTEGWDRVVVETRNSNVSNLVPPSQRGVEYLTFEDALRVGYLEGKVYRDNESLMQFMFNMENALIAKDINNVAKNRPNMSLKYIDDSGRMQGYFLAWEGKLTDEVVATNAEQFSDKPCLYMMDIATDPEHKMAGGRLIKAFIELYKLNYLDQGNLVPIFAQARESTSFKIIQKQLERMGRQTDTRFELIELPTYEAGNDTMHPVIIIPYTT